MYIGLLHTHNLFRYIILILLVSTVINACIKWFGGKNVYSKIDDKLGVYTLISVHIQLLIGIVLYILSPTVRTFLENPAEMMGESLYRFYGVEHVFGMCVAIALITFGRMRIKKTAHPQKKHIKTALFYGIALLIMIASIPLPYRGF